MKLIGNNQGGGMINKMSDEQKFNLFVLIIVVIGLLFIVAGLIIAWAE
jgi:hypothetical protein